MPSQRFIDDTQRQKSITVPATTARGFEASGTGHRRTERTEPNRRFASPVRTGPGLRFQKQNPVNPVQPDEPVRGTQGHGPSCPWPDVQILRRVSPRKAPPRRPRLLPGVPHDKVTLHDTALLLTPSAFPSAEMGKAKARKKSTEEYKPLQKDTNGIGASQRRDTARDGAARALGNS